MNSAPYLVFSHFRIKSFGCFKRKAYLCSRKNGLNLKTNYYTKMRYANLYN